MQWSRLICVCVLAGMFATRGWPGQRDDFFENKIRPILAGNCYGCHTDSHLGGLRLDSRESMLKGGKSGPALVSGDPDDSLMIQAVRQTHERLKMPPGKKLADSEIAALAEWIKTGALWPE